MLLNNTSGVPGNKLYGFLIAGEEHYQGNMNNLLEWLASRELSFEPGAMYEYSNNNWTLLGIIAARVLGHDNYFEGFAELANENIFAPLGMERSTFEFTPGLTNVAMPYITLGEQDVMHTLSPAPAGSLLSSAYEMALFMHSVFGGGVLLEPETLAYMKQGHTEMVPGIMEYGLGFARLSLGEIELVGHDGALVHYHTGMFLEPETGLGVFVSTNTVSGILVASGLGVAVLDAAITEKTGAAPVLHDEADAEAEAEAAALSEEELEWFAQFEGVYDFGEAGVWEMSIIDGVLTWALGEFTIELTPLPDGTFDSPAGNYSFEFVDGAAIAMLTAGDMEIPGIRIDDAEGLAPPEGFLDWVGIYNFMPQVENEAPVTTQIVISVSPLGSPLMSTEQAIFAYIDGAAAAPLAEYNGYWFIGLIPVRFLVDEDGNRSIDMLGAIFVMQE
jgi:CubicO group peptidase (beta-lactamase class C family)